MSTPEHPPSPDGRPATRHRRRRRWSPLAIAGSTVVVLVGLVALAELVRSAAETAESDVPTPSAPAATNEPPTTTSTRPPTTTSTRPPTTAPDTVPGTSPDRSPGTTPSTALAPGFDATPDAPSSDRPSASSSREDRLLRWPPPDGWEDYETASLPPEGGRVRLDPDTDYRLAAEQAVSGPLELIGGRNIVWIAGEIVIPRSGPADAPRRAIGLTVRDGTESDADDRVVHLEGLFIGGSGLSEGIDIDAPSAIVQIQNVHIDDVTFAGADDRDGTGSYEGEGRNHPDVVQTYGGHRELRIDGLSAQSGYQGLFLKIDHPDGRRGTVRLRNVHVEAIEFTGVDGVDYAGNRMYFWDAATIGDQFVDTGTVWIEHHENAGKVAGIANPRPGSGAWWHGAYRDQDSGELVLEPPPGTAGPADAVERLRAGEPVVVPRFDVDRHGPYLWWPMPDSDRHSALLDSTGEAPGRLHLGTPPGGTYVPRSMVGLAYDSPGHHSPGQRTEMP